MGEYAAGTGIRITVGFTASDAAADPTDVFFDLLSPDGTETTYEFGVDADIVKADTGSYYVDLTPAAGEGRYTYRWRGTGSLPVTTRDRHLFVTDSVFE